jgi:GTP-binding protein
VTGEAGLPVVAIVGRPNVGKSSLFNRLLGARRAIVDDAPGVTRDRVTARASSGGRAFTLVDTGGFSADPPRDRATIAARVREQALAAMEEADCVVCVLDGQAGIVAEDRDVVRLLRRSGKPVLWVVNKIDTPGREALLSDVWSAGVGEPFAVSAAHGRGIAELRDAIVAALPEHAAAPEAARGTRLALLGRPNVGKSSLLNRLLGSERAIVAPEPGTTRDAVDTVITVDGRPYVLVDTAGIRKRGRVRDDLERHGAVRALGQIEGADLALIVLDAADGITDQDARIIGRAWEAGRGVLLLANKWDTVPRARRDATSFRAAATALRPAFASLPMLCVSAHTGEGVAEIFPRVAAIEQAYGATLPTPALNRALRTAVGEHPPASVRGRVPSLLYATQTGMRPPVVTIFSSKPAAIAPDYVRYLATRLRDAFGLVGVPLRLSFRARSATERRAGGRAPGARRSPPRTGAGARSRRR